MISSKHYSSRHGNRSASITRIGRKDYKISMVKGTRFTTTTKVATATNIKDAQAIAREWVGR